MHLNATVRMCVCHWKFNMVHSTSHFPRKHALCIITAMCICIDGYIYIRAIGTQWLQQRNRSYVFWLWYLPHHHSHHQYNAIACVCVSYHQHMQMNVKCIYAPLSHCVCQPTFVRMCELFLLSLTHWKLLCGIKKH